MEMAETPTAKQNQAGTEQEPTWTAASDTEEMVIEKLQEEKDEMMAMRLTEMDEILIELLSQDGLDQVTQVYERAEGMG